MSSQYISAALRRRIAEAFQFRFGYCHTSQHVVGPLLEIDHNKGPTTSHAAKLRLVLLNAMPIRNTRRSLPG